MNDKKRLIAKLQGIKPENMWCYNCEHMKSNVTTKYPCKAMGYWCDRYKMHPVYMRLGGLDNDKWVCYNIDMTDKELMKRVKDLTEVVLILVDKG